MDFIILRQKVEATIKALEIQNDEQANGEFLILLNDFSSRQIARIKQAITQEKIREN